MSDVPDILGHSKAEIRRQSIEAAMVEPITERLLRAAGVKRGMRVLDLGCGGGDGSMLAAELVGLTGSVVGIDRSAEAVMAARRRARAVGHANIEFRWDSAEEFYDPLPFDAVIGRYVLVHQADPERFLRAATSHVKPGGILAFHEAAMYGQLYCLPAVPLMQQVWDWMVAAYASLPHRDAPGRMIEHFQSACLSQPVIFCETPVGGGPDCSFYALAAYALSSLLPQLEKIGVTTAAEVDVGTLCHRLRYAVTAVRAQVSYPMQVCGWTQC